MKEFQIMRKFRLYLVLLSLTLLAGAVHADDSDTATPAKNETNVAAEMADANNDTQLDTLVNTNSWLEDIDQDAIDQEIETLVIEGIDFTEILAEPEVNEAVETAETAKTATTGGFATADFTETTLYDVLTTGTADESDADLEDLIAQDDEPPTLLLPEEVEEAADLKRPVAEEKYQLQIGDRLLLSIYGEPGTSREVVVDSTGSISYLLVGRVVAIGKTIDDLRRELDVKIKETFKYAFVTVTPVEFGGQYFTILGEVVKPGKKILSGKMTLLSALCEAGGFRTGHFRNQTIELADLEHAFLARDGDYVPVDFDRLVIQGDLSQDVVLRPYDYVYIPNSLYKEIHILGEVNIPTTIGFLNTVSLSEAISQARGVTPRSSSRVFIIRGSLSNPIRIEADINRIFKGLEKDVLLQPGDIVYVPVRRFENFREVVRAGIRAFVGAAANEGGNRAFIYVHPHARGDAGTIRSVQVIQ